MKKNLLLIQLLVLSLYAKEASSVELNSIYIEAILFVAVFGVMGIVSYIYSKKHAKEYAPKKEKAEKREQENLSTRVEELSQMLKSNHLTQDEFNILEDYYKSKS